MSHFIFINVSQGLLYIFYESFPKFKNMIKVINVLKIIAVSYTFFFLNPVNFTCADC